MMTQFSVEHVNEHHFCQCHHLLNILSGHFKGSSLGISTLEKKTSMIMFSIERIHSLFAINYEFDLLADHDGLFFIRSQLCGFPSFVIDFEKNSLLRCPSQGEHLHMRSHL